MSSGAGDALVGAVFGGVVRAGGLASIAIVGLTPFRGHRLSGLRGRGDELVFEGYWADLAQRAVPPRRL